MSDALSLHEIRRATRHGQNITADDASVIGQLEGELLNIDGHEAAGGEGTGPMERTAQDLAARQMDFDAKMDELAGKPRGHITGEDAREIEELEARAFDAPPDASSVSAQVRSIADRNEALNLPPVSADAPPAFVTKDDAADAQHEEARIYGGQNPKGGMAAQMQSAADKLERARRDN
ncbi:hypothetical protein BDV18DRAFT_160367 [Aspergillus unguis]